MILDHSTIIVQYFWFIIISEGLHWLFLDRLKSRHLCVPVSIHALLKAGLYLRFSKSVHICLNLRLADAVSVHILDVWRLLEEIVLRWISLNWIIPLELRIH